MRKWAILLAALVWAIPAGAQLDGFAQPGSGFSARASSNGLEWKNSEGIGVYDRLTGAGYGVLTTDEGSAGFDWSGPAYVRNNSAPYTMGPHRLDHRARTDAQYFSLCEPSPQFVYTQDVCAWGLMGEEVPLQTNGLAGAQTFQSTALGDVSIAEMSAYPDSFDTGSPNALITPPKVSAGTPLSSQFIDPLPGTWIQYFNNAAQTGDAGPIISNNVNILAYFGPNPTSNSNCDQYGDCQWQQPSGYTSNWGAPQTSSPFWTHPNDAIPSNTFIYGNSVTMLGIMEAHVNKPVAYTDEGSPALTGDIGCIGWVGNVIGRANGAQTYLFIDHGSQDIQLLDYGCQANGLNCFPTKVHDWQIAGATCSGGNAPSSQAMPAVPNLVAEMEVKMNAERTHAPSMERMEALADAGVHVSPMYLANDSDGMRWHVGVVGPGVTRDGMLAPGKGSAGMKMAVAKEFTANGASAPVVLEPGFMMRTGK